MKKIIYNSFNTDILGALAFVNIFIIIHFLIIGLFLLIPFESVYSKNQSSVTVGVKDTTDQAIINLELNKQIILKSSEVGITYQSNAFQILTFQPQGNYPVELSVASGGDDIVTIPIHESTTTAQAYISDFNENAISITNQSISSTEVKIGYFGLAANPTFQLTPSGGKVVLEQYQSLGVISQARDMKLVIECRSEESMLFGLMVGANEPKLIAINTDPDDSLPDQYNRVKKYLEAVKGNVYTLSKNWEGKSLFLVNISLRKVSKDNACNCMISAN